MPDTERHGGEAKEAVNDEKGYALSGKIMLIAIVILFIVIIIMLCLHVYARWYLERARRRHRNVRRTTHRSQQFFFYVDPSAPAALTVASRGLHASVIASLPVFTFSPKTHLEPLDCPVCLSELQDGETGRVLPRCNHSFHSDCIDMWFHSHSTCPLCRAPVELPPAGETRPEVIVTVCDTEPGSSSGLCRFGGEEVNRTGGAVSTRVGDESGCDSPSTQSSSSFLSPMSRMLSLKRILSRERKGNSIAELDAEQGGREGTQ